jgi:hypothetical protein
VIYGIVPSDKEQTKIKTSGRFTSLSPLTFIYQHTCHQHIATIALPTGGGWPSGLAPAYRWRPLLVSQGLEFDPRHRLESLRVLTLAPTTTEMKPVNWWLSSRRTGSPQLSFSSGNLFCWLKLLIFFFVDFLYCYVVESHPRANLSCLFSCRSYNLATNPA